MSFYEIRSSWPYFTEFNTDEVLDLTLLKIKQNEELYVPNFINETSFITTYTYPTNLSFNNLIIMIEMFLYTFKLCLCKEAKIKSNDAINFSQFHILQYFNITSFNNETQKIRPRDFLSYFLDGIGPVITDEVEDINSLNKENFTIKVSSKISKPYHANSIIYSRKNVLYQKYAVKEYGAIAFQIEIKEKDIDYEKKNCYTGTNWLSLVNCVIIGWDDKYSRLNFKNKPDEDGAFLVKVFGLMNVTYLWVSYCTNMDSQGYSFGDIDKSLFVDESIKIYAYDNPSKVIGDWRFFEKSYISEEYGEKIPELEGSTKNVFYTTYINNEYLIAVKFYVGGMAYYKLIFEQNNESTILDEGYPYEYGYYTFILKEPIKLITNKFSVKVAIKGNTNFYSLYAERKRQHDFIEPNQSYVNDYDISYGMAYLYDKMISQNTPDDKKYYTSVHYYPSHRFGPCLIRAITKIDGIIKDAIKTFKIESNHDGYSISSNRIEDDNGNEIKITLKKSKEDDKDFFISFDGNKYYIVNSKNESIKVDITITGEYNYSRYSEDIMIELRGSENPIHKSEILTNYDVSQLVDHSKFDNLPYCLNNNVFNPLRIQFQNTKNDKYLHNIGLMYENEKEKYYPSGVFVGGIDFAINNYIQKINAYILLNVVYLQTVTENNITMQNILYDKVNKTLDIGTSNKVIAFYGTRDETLGISSIGVYYKRI